MPGPSIRFIRVLHILFASEQVHIRSGSISMVPGLAPVLWRGQVVTSINIYDHTVAQFLHTSCKIFGL